MNILEQKSKENLDVAKKCIFEKYCNTAISRLYYAIYQKIKGSILKDTAFYNPYVQKPIKPPTRRKNDYFEHGVIAQLIDYYLKQKNSNYNQTEGDKVRKTIGHIYRYREIADYYELNITHVQAKNLCIETKYIIDFIDANLEVKKDEL